MVGFCAPRPIDCLPQCRCLMCSVCLYARRDRERRRRRDIDEYFGLHGKMTTPTKRTRSLAHSSHNQYLWVSHTFHAACRWVASGMLPPVSAPPSGRVDPGLLFSQQSQVALTNTSRMAAAGVAAAAVPVSSPRKKDAALLPLTIGGLEASGVTIRTF